MSDAYYDPHPLVSLELPLALVGHPGAGISKIARAICGRTGLPFNDVSRSAEARAGRSRSQLLLEGGLSELRAREAEALRSALRRRPCGIIGFCSGLLEDRELHRFVAQRSCLVYVRRPVSVLLARIRDKLTHQPGSEPEFLAGVPATPEELREHLVSRELGLREIEVIFEAGDLHEHRVAGELLASLDRLVGGAAAVSSL